MAVTFEAIAKEARSRFEDIVVDMICAEVRTMLLHGDKRTEISSPHAHQ